MDDSLTTLKAIRAGLQDQFSSKLLSGATITAVKTGPGFLHSIMMGALSSPTLTLYDMASGASGTIIAQVNGNQNAGSYIVDAPFTTGLTAVFQLAAGAQPCTTLSYK